MHECSENLFSMHFFLFTVRKYQKSSAHCFIGLPAVKGAVWRNQDASILDKFASAFVWWAERTRQMRWMPFCWGKWCQVRVVSSSFLLTPPPKTLKIVRQFYQKKKQKKNDWTIWDVFTACHQYLQWWKRDKHLAIAFSAGLCFGHKQGRSHNFALSPTSAVFELSTTQHSPNASRGWDTCRNSCWNMQDHCHCRQIDSIKEIRDHASKWTQNLQNWTFGSPHHLFRRRWISRRVTHFFPWRQRQPFFVRSFWPIRNLSFGEPETPTQMILRLLIVPTTAWALIYKSLDLIHEKIFLGSSRS